MKKLALVSAVILSVCQFAFAEGPPPPTGKDAVEWYRYDAGPTGFDTGGSESIPTFPGGGQDVDPSTLACPIGQTLRSQGSYDSRGFTVVYTCEDLVPPGNG